MARYRYNIDLVCPNNHRGEKGDPSIKGSHLNPSVLYCSQSAWHCLKSSVAAVCHLRHPAAVAVEVVFTDVRLAGLLLLA